MSITVPQTYELGRIIGQGSYSKVRLATHIPTGQKMAIKTYRRSSLLINPQLHRMIQREIVLLYISRHPNIITIHDVIQTNNHLYIVLEYLPRGDLTSLLGDTPIPIPVAFNIVFGVITGLDYLHTLGFCHRDIKPENVLLGEEGVVKLSDFGFANLCLPHRPLSTRCGSVYYVAPEVLRRNAAYDGTKSDIWSVGVMLFEMCAGYLPFQGESQIEVARKVVNGFYCFPIGLEPELRDFIGLMLVRDAKIRSTTKEIKKHYYWLTMCSKFQLTNKCSVKSPLATFIKSVPNQNQTLPMDFQSTGSVLPPYPNTWTSRIWAVQDNEIEHNDEEDEHDSNKLTLTPVNESPLYNSHCPQIVSSKKLISSAVYLISELFNERSLYWTMDIISDSQITNETLNRQLSITYEMSNEMQRTMELMNYEIMDLNERLVLCRESADIADTKYCNYTSLIDELLIYYSKMEEISKSLLDFMKLISTVIQIHDKTLLLLHSCHSIPQEIVQLEARVHLLQKEFLDSSSADFQCIFHSHKNEGGWWNFHETIVDSFLHPQKPSKKPDDELLTERWVIAGDELRRVFREMMSDMIDISCDDLPNSFKRPIHPPYYQHVLNSMVVLGFNPNEIQEYLCSSEPNYEKAVYYWLCHHFNESKIPEVIKKLDPPPAKGAIATTTKAQKLLNHFHELKDQSPNVSLKSIFGRRKSDTTPVDNVEVKRDPFYKMPNSFSAPNMFRIFKK